MDPPHTYDPSWCVNPKLSSSQSSSDVYALRGDRRHAATIMEAEAWAERLRNDIHWARTQTIRAEKPKELDILEHLINHAR